jgi:O-antigen ligase
LSVVIPGIALENINGNLLLRSYATFSHPNSMAGFLLVGLILTLPFIKNRRFFWGYVGLLLWGIFLSFSYSAWLVGAVVLSLYFFLIKKKRFLLISSLFSGGLFVFFGFQFNSQPVTERWQLMVAAFSMIQDNFFFGVGLNNFIVKLSNYWIPEAYRLWQPVHNLYLLIFAETGIFVFILVSVFIFLSVKKLIIGKNYYPLLAFIAILFLGLFDHYWLTLQQNQILLSIVLGLLWRKNLSKDIQ